MEHLRAPFAGPVLSYGKQAMNVGYDGTLKMLATLGIVPHPDGMVDPPPPDEYIDFARLFRLLGLGELQTLDVSAYEGAEIIADLNLPVPLELTSRFGLIVDGGTMEHVFDIRQGMKNTADMLLPGGRAVHISPMNNYVNHGFVQLSPSLYQDYYAANGFDDLRGIVIAQPRAEILSTDWNFVEYDHATMCGENSIFCSEETQMAIYFSARKNAASTSDRVPAQSSRGGTGYQFVISHGAGQPKIQQISEHDPGPNVPAHELVHVGFGSGRELNRL
jgi:hypothetical protein